MLTSSAGPRSARAIPAVVVGLCSHGLAICRSLGQRGIPVFAVESKRDLPGWNTRFARKIHAPDINGESLCQTLIEARSSFKERPVLFLTNDNMVRTVAKHYAAIESLYRIQWPSTDLVLRLIDKENLESITRDSGLLYPETQIVSGSEEIRRLQGHLHYPVILKPSMPLSPFRAFKLDSEVELLDKLTQFGDRVDRFLVQEWIDGSEECRYALTFYFDHEHRPVARFVIRKIWCFPRDTGIVCCAEPADRDDLLELGLKFFRGLGVRGPAALEIKETPDGRRYVIEPTVGRFDSPVHCCTVNGVDLPFIAYCSQTENRVPEMKRSPRSVVWIDFKAALPAVLDRERPIPVREVMRMLFRKKAFCVWAWSDMRPSFRAWRLGVKSYCGKVMTRLGAVVRRGGENPST